MEHRSLEINVISAKDLKKVNMFSKMQVYAVVSISGEPRASQQQRTAVDRNGNASPAWNFPVKFTVDESAARSNRLSVTFRIRCERTLGDKDIGEVHVPLSELVGSIEDGKLQFVTYQVRKPSGRPKGELNFSYKWGEKIVGAKIASAALPAMEVNKAQEPVTAYPAQVGSSSAYPPPPTGYAYQPPAGYPSASAAGYGYPPPPQYGAYPQQPPPPGYGYPPPQPGYGYPPVQQPQQPPKKNKMGLGLGAGLLGGALGGLLLVVRNTRNMGQESFVYSFVARGTTVVAEYAAVTGNFPAVATQCLQRLPSANNKFSYNCEHHAFNFLVKDGYGRFSISMFPAPPFMLAKSYCVVAKESVENQLSLAFLENLKADFEKRYVGGTEADTAVAKSLDKEFGPIMKEHMQYTVDNAEEIIGKLAKVKAQVSQVKSAMLDNIVKVTDRGESLAILDGKAQDLRDSAQQYKKTATQINRKMWYKNMKTKLVVIGILLLLALIIWLSVCRGFNCTK
ncbi:hypothetical protein RHSIM_Rhsim02G0009700 [Rhododendron simsii]|uniref:Uncharacterized protein n=1 Tax=Rhododendron simsii TaxID=118357 RepID=A0A834HLZ1_RHOSS|nr:hypothetical protein RHSIM_Rhsim02G0009700 [Rhododendron simsii]